MTTSINYLGWHFEAERRHDRGERQTYCLKCRRWFFSKWLADKRRHLERCAEAAGGGRGDG